MMNQLLKIFSLTVVLYLVYLQVQKVKEIQSGPDLNTPVKTYYTPSLKQNQAMITAAKKLGLKKVSKKSEADIQICYNICKHSNVKEGQLIIYMRDDYIINSKTRLTAELKEFDRKNQPYKGYNSSFFYPESYQLNFESDKETKALLKNMVQDEHEFISKEREGIWILKPTDGMQGFGIRVIQNVTSLQETVRYKQQGKRDPNFKYPNMKINKFIIQKYIENPLLLDGKKFDLRCFIGIVSSQPMIATFYMGYIRKTMVDFDPFSEDIMAHLGNGDIQKKHPDFNQKSASSQYNGQQFKELLKEQFQNYTDEDFLELEKKVKLALSYALIAVKPKIRQRRGDIQIFSADIVIDDNFYPHIVELNRTPYLKSSSGMFANLFPPMVTSWFKLSFKLQEMKSYKIFQQSKEDPEFFCRFLKNQENCQVLINEASNYSFIDTYDLSKLEKPKFRLAQKKE